MSWRTRALNWLSGGDFSAAMNGLREASDLLLERYKEDAQWLNLTADTDSDKPGERAQIRDLARWAFNGGEAFVKAAVWLKTAFTFGNGIDGPVVPEKDPAYDVLMDFWHEPRNQGSMFSTGRQYERSNQLLVDGDLFLLVFTKPDPIQVRRILPEVVTDVIRDPDDTSRPLYYVTEADTLVYSGGALSSAGDKKKRYYPDILNDQGADDPLRDEISPEPDGHMLHVPLNRITGYYGTSEAAASLNWFMRAKRIATDQATVSRATAALMNLLTITGSSTNVANVAAQFIASSSGEGDDATHHAPPLPGAMNVMNEAAALEVNRKTTQGSDANTNSRLMMKPAAAGFGMTLHYLADPENANLATTKSMELPVLKMMTVYQALWIDTYRQLCDFALQQKGIKPRDSEYDIPVPRMIEPEIEGVAKAVLDGYAEGILTRDQAATRLLTVLGVDDIGKELEALEQEVGEPEAKTTGEEAANALDALFAGGAEDGTEVQPPEV